ncbi:MAG: ThuA domain-containing protein [Candidatus Cyclobacteriaceae bacterium M3_2C_046]
MMANSRFFISLLLAIITLWSCSEEKEERILIFSKTAGYRHQSIPVAKQALTTLLKQEQIRVDTTEDAAYFVTDSLKQYSAVIFLLTSGNVLDHRQQAHFERYIQAGGGYVGLHSAVDTEYSWPWYGKLAGAYFSNHPKPQQATIQVVDSQHLATRHLPKSWQRFDEWYNFKQYNDAVNVLALLDESTYEGGTHGDFHPTSWYHQYDGGRAFYTAGGHTGESYQEPLFLQHVLGGIRYAMGDNQLDYKNARSPLVPEENRFVKQVMINNLNEPMELEVLPEGKVLFIERKGAVKLYLPEADQVKLLAKMNVHTRFEDGLIGLALDPDYQRNHWIYMYYSPAGEEPVQRLSRFVFIADSLFLHTEKTILEVPVQREKCCHTGGSIEFGPDGLLYLSTGDDTSPFNDKQLVYNSDGYGPMNELPGWKPYDAQRSSGNTNDLRGKILRIKLNPDASYDIPEGNLFAPGDTLARPEIYVMGCRNPYRISIDPKTNMLYYGDVGPDAGEASPRGPAGHDELNQVRQAGNFGWPYFVADNKPYAHYNYATGEIGDLFVPEKPLNNSVNNTGRKVLPPAQPALIYYPYDQSSIFENLATGGRNAMAGPVYYADQYPASQNKLPDYYSGKLFFYDWMRDWIMAVSFDENHNLSHYEPFLPGFEFANIVDITIGPDGAMYMLEYGSNWFSQNIDATLSRIDYAEGNRIPVARIAADRLIGAAPLQVQFSASQSFDFDREDELRYAWYFTDQDEPQAEGMETQYTFDRPGIYQTVVRVIDGSGDFATASLEVKVGNAIPRVDIEFNGNSSFFWPGQTISYAVKVQDQEDGSYPGTGIEADRISFSIDYMQVGLDETMTAQGHRQKSDLINGASLIEENNCFACHKVDEKSIGPTYLQVADRYEATEENISLLANKIIKGGSGNWGEQNMSAHPQVSLEEATTIVYYILALNDEQDQPSMPLAGDFKVAQEDTLGYYLFTASYSDRGGEVVGPLRGAETRRLRYPGLELEAYDSATNVRVQRPRDQDVEVVVTNGLEAWLMFDQIDLNQVSELVFTGGADRDGFVLEVRQGSHQGSLVGSVEIPVTEASRRLYTFALDVYMPNLANGREALYVVLKNNSGDGEANVYLDKVEVQRQNVGS